MTGFDRLSQYLDELIERELNVDDNPRCSDPRCKQPVEHKTCCEGCGETFCAKHLQRDEETACFFCATCAAICPYCGEVGGTPVELPDVDLSVGYEAVEQRCSCCYLERRQVASETNPGQTLSEVA